MLFAVEQAAVPPHMTVWIIALCALTNVIIAISQALVIPFVRGVRSDVKELTTTIISHQLTLKEVQLMQNNATIAQGKAGEQAHKLNNRVNDLMLHLAAKGIYIPRSVREEEQQDRT